MCAAASQPQSKNQRRRAVLKARKQQAATNGASTTDSHDTPTREDESTATESPQAQTISNEIDENDPLYAQFRDILGRFEDPDKESPALKQPEKPEVYFDDDDDIPDEDDELAAARLSKKKRKEQSKFSIAELKALVQKPELVEWTDVSSRDPQLLVALKSQRNIVPVPPHWSLKREYLSSKRGIEKSTFQLPKFIQDTGIAEMRDAVLEKQDQATLKQRQRERVQPKMGKLDIDYQRLYEAFFRHQEKPELTRYGEVYYEGKEYETNMKHLRPGELSDELREALNIPPGAPPPWLINQQRFGPPPSYPGLRIPGLNAPPPSGSSWGFHPGGYGKPPIDELNRPLYGGDVFGTSQGQQDQHTTEPVDKSLWGELQQIAESEGEGEDEEDEGDEDEEGDDDEEMADGIQTGVTAGTASVDPSSYGGTDSVHGDFTLRKNKRDEEAKEMGQGRTAGQVLPEQNVHSQGFFGSERGYDLRQAQGPNQIPMLGEQERGRKRKAGDVDVSVDLDAIQRDDKLTKDELQKTYDARRQEQSNPWEHGAGEDLSEMIAQESAKRLKLDTERRGKQR